MNAESLLSTLQALDIRLIVEGDQLRCSAPKGQLTVELGQQIAAHKLELIRTLTRADELMTPIPRRPEGSAPAPTSSAQERFWFMHQLEPESTAYNITAVAQIDASVTAETLEAAWRTVSDRHAILRTQFREAGGTPVQEVRPHVAPALEVHDLTPLDDAEKKAAFDAITGRLSRTPFDLGSAPLWRAALVRFSGREQCVVITIHHILCDGWSMGVLFSELDAACRAYTAGQAEEIAPLPLQYADYAAWERGRDHSAEVRAHLDYWRQKLSGAPASLELPLDHPREATRGRACRLHSFELEAKTSEAVRVLADREGVTHFVALLAAFKTLLSRYTRQDDIVVGTPVSTRNRTELESLIGCFLNTHVLRTKIPAEATSREVMARVRTTVLESLEHCGVPFERLVHELVTERNIGLSPLFQVAFILKTDDGPSHFQVLSGGTNFDLTLYMSQAGETFRGTLEYNPELLHETTITAMAECYQALIAGMAAHPDTPVARLPLLTAEQERSWFPSLTGAVRPIPALRAEAWIAQRARITPNAVAVVAGNERLTYRELDEAANRLAHELRSLGVARGSLVGLCLDRSARMAIAPLAVWKAGGAYLPLDPDFPKDRLAFMLDDSGASVLVTESHLLDRLPATMPRVLWLDHDRAWLDRDGSAPPMPDATADDRAYVIYTSGSTGRPKGVEIGHRALVNFLSSMRQEPGLSANDRLLAVTTFSFDIAGLELYLPLVTGARVVIAPHDATTNPQALLELLRQHRISAMQATPATWRMLLEAGWENAAGLKVLCGGEALTLELMRRMLATGAEVWNLYGPTETTIWSTQERLTPETDQVSIGRPIANTRIHLLDAYGHPVPPGVAGELFIGGDGLAQGYLHRPELTAERFVHSAFHGGARLYRTGDLVRCLPDGGLEYKGRIDHQVKVRGYRIELGEIETALEQQPGVAQAVVIVREDVADDPQLTAYLTASGEPPPDPDGLRKALAGALPPYMVPASFVTITAFPLSPNRKVNRNALRGPEYRPGRTKMQTGAPAPAEAPASPAAPANSIEATMVEIWREVLGVDQVRVRDNFFELGGHSLTAVRLISRLRAAFEMELPLKFLFLYPTIEELARRISYDPATRSYLCTAEVPKWSCLVPVQPRGTKPPIFFVAGYENPDDTMLALSQITPHLGLDQPLFGLRPRWIEGSQGYSTVADMAEEFVTELRRAQPQGPYRLAGHCVGGIAALEVAQRLQEQGEDVVLMAFLDVERPSRLRTLQLDLHYFHSRVSHICEVLYDLARSGRRFVPMAKKLIHRKLYESNEFYEAKVAYRRQLYTHMPHAYQGRITLIVNQDEAGSRGRDLGWSNIARGGLDIHVVPGNHETILAEHADMVAQAIIKARNQIDASSEPPSGYGPCASTAN